MIENKYHKIYFSIVNRAKSRAASKKEAKKILLAVESHHIIPKCIGGSNDASNIAHLTPREHFICHRLLVKMTEGAEKRKMSHAIWRMCTSRKETINSRTYDHIRTQHAEHLKQTRGENHPNTGRKTGRTSASFTEEWKQAIALAATGRVPWNKGRPVSEEQKKKQSETKKSKRGQPGFNVRQKGAKWFHDPITLKSRLALPNDAQALIEQGWIAGRILMKTQDSA